MATRDPTVARDVLVLFGGVNHTADDSRDLLAEPTAWVFGNEARGLREDAVSLADVSMRLPIYGQAESLNLATAASVCLYETAFAQRAD